MRHVEALQLGHLPTVEPWREALARLHGPGAPRLPGAHPVLSYKRERDAAGGGRD